MLLVMASSASVVRTMPPSPSDPPRCQPSEGFGNQSSSTPSSNRSAEARWLAVSTAPEPLPVMEAFANGPPSNVPFVKFPWISAATASPGTGEPPIAAPNDERGPETDAEPEGPSPNSVYYPTPPEK